MYSICVGNPLGNDLPKCPLYPPCLAVPEGCIDVEKVSELLLIEMRHTLHSSCKETISATPQEAELSQTSSRRLEITCTTSCTLREYAMTENDKSDSSSSTSDGEELGNDVEEEHEQRDVARH